ncbi:MAG: MBL fold metallo-hydrolase [Anaerolineae bacterium]|nr:MBL fold metallo-hydrolase [Anaerolineae bacterium]
MLQQISPNVYLHRDTCNVYIIRSGKEAVLIDFGDGSALTELDALGIERITAVLMTHHHRDQGQGLPQAVADGVPIYVPHTEQDLFKDVEAHWQARTVYNNYDVRQDRFSLLQNIEVTGTLQDYCGYDYCGHTFMVIPTPGHTLGSITLLAEIDGQRFAFTGDLIAGNGKVWSMAATQWTYNGAEGVAASIPSLIDLKQRKPDVLLPSHGAPMFDPQGAIDLLVYRLRELLDLRHQNLRMMQLIAKPYEPILPHLLRNRTSMANSYVLLSDSGKALFIEYGYDFMTGLSAGSDRTSRRPWLYTLPKLKEQFGVTHIDVVIPTHYHDDHVAGINLLRDIEGARVWAAENFADILKQPSRYDLPCLWYEPINVDRILPLAQPIQWEEYTLLCYPLPGHTLHAVAIFVEVDGKRVLAAGDQYQENIQYNYVYKNRFRAADYVASAELYRTVRPDVILSGHWDPYWVESTYFDTLMERGTALERLHHDLLGMEEVDLGADGTTAWIRPYQIETTPVTPVALEVEIVNPFAREVEASFKLVTPWHLEPAEHRLKLPANATCTYPITLTPPENSTIRRARIAIDLTINGQHFGQQAEALITVKGKH